MVPHLSTAKTQEEFGSYISFQGSPAPYHTHTAYFTGSSSTFPSSEKRFSYPVESCCRGRYPDYRVGTGNCSQAEERQLVSLPASSAAPASSRFAVSGDGLRATAIRPFTQREHFTCSTPALFYKLKTGKGTCPHPVLMQ